MLKPRTVRYKKQSQEEAAHAPAAPYRTAPADRAVRHVVPADRGRALDHRGPGHGEVLDQGDRAGPRPAERVVRPGAGPGPGPDSPAAEPARGRIGPSAALARAADRVPGRAGHHGGGVG